jgi:hypothetical protein
MTEYRVAVLAGTPVDTAMGVEYIKNKNSEAEGQYILPLYEPVSESCDSQLKFQYSDNDEKLAVMNNIFDPLITDGVRDFFIYCNSLSGSFNFDSYAASKSLECGDEIRVYTPLQVYRSLGESYSRIGVMAANNLSAYAIEEALMSTRNDIYVIGTGNMAIVRAIEDGLSPEEVVQKCGLEKAVKYMETCGAEAIVLGCTHFPYFKEELAKLTALPLIDPADRMHEALTGAIR